MQKEQSMCTLALIDLDGLPRSQTISPQDELRAIEQTWGGNFGRHETSGT